LGGLAQRFEPLERAGIAAGEDGLHNRKPYVALFIRAPVQHIFMLRGKGKRHLPFQKPFLRNHFEQ
jgi:hypothetical protein